MPQDPGLALQDLVYAGLEAMRAAVTADLCAYLHASGDHAPQLYLAAPDLGSTDPTEAFNLFTALRDALDDDHTGEETFLIGGFAAVAVTSSGPRSRGFHVVGRREIPLEPEERALVARMATSIGTILHTLEDVPRPAGPPTPGDRPRPARVAVETVDGRARAEVSASLGAEIRTGMGEGPTPIHAVANAVLDLTGGGLKVVEVSEGDVAGDRVVLVLLVDTYDRRAVGAGLVTESIDALSAAAAAALEAATRLSG